ncbi:MAG: flavodoxin family protein [Archaeoglobales archaeon]|nr:flavodoxin family protein [Archaeoglobales archaeon]
MKVVGIVGSPRAESNTEILVQKVLEGAKSKGAEVEIFKINDMNINWCQGCFYCQQYGECKQKDDMQLIYKAIKSADALVIGTPIYMGHVTAQTKTFLDRLLAMINVFKGDSALKGKNLAIIYSQGRGNDGETVLKELGTRLSNFGMKFVGIVGGNGLNEPGAVKKKEDLLKAAYQLGTRIV